MDLQLGHMIAQDLGMDHQLVVSGPKLAKMDPDQIMFRFQTAS